MCVSICPLYHVKVFTVGQVGWSSNEAASPFGQISREKLDKFAEKNSDE